MLNGAVHVILSWESGFEWFIQRGSKTIDTRWFVFVCYNGNIHIYQFGGPFSIVCLWKSMDGTKENPYAFVVYKFISVTYVISSGSKGNILFLRHRLAFEKKAIELALRKTFIVNECMRWSLRKTNNTHICNKFGRNEQRKKMRVFKILYWTVLLWSRVLGCGSSQHTYPPNWQWNRNFSIY